MSYATPKHYTRCDDLPCTRCGSVADDCQCVTETELATLYEALGLHMERPLTFYEQARARQVRIDNDVAATACALREYGYR